MEAIAYHDFGIHCMSRRPGVLGWPDKVSPVVKYTFQYIFAQAEFGLLCPISATDTSAMLIERYGDEDTRQRFLPGMWSMDKADIVKGAQFMTITDPTSNSEIVFMVFVMLITCVNCSSSPTNISNLGLGR